MRGPVYRAPSLPHLALPIGVVQLQSHLGQGETELNDFIGYFFLSISLDHLRTISLSESIN